MRHLIRRGFTLLELLIVVAVIGVLLTLLVPTLFKTWVVADHTRCTTNLYYLSHAIAMRWSEPMLGPMSGLRTRSWPSQLLPYLETGATCFVCPGASGEEYLVADQTLGGGEEGSSSSSSSGGGQGTPDPMPSAGYPPFSDLAELRIGAGTAYQPMDAGPWTLKLSEEQAQAARAVGYLGKDGGATTGMKIRSYMDTTYKPGADPYTYYLCFEDGIATGGDQDFQDTVIRVADKRNGTYELTVSGATAGHHAIVSKPDRQILLDLPNVSGNYYTNLQLVVGQEEAGADGSGSYAPGSFATGEPGVDYGTSSRVVLSTNYAMNGDTEYLTSHAGKVALMDYTKYLVHGTDDWTEYWMDPSRDGVPVFARHWGQVNVLMTDGSVKLMSAADLDPARPDAYVRYWTP
jgi:prepilin-type N-terminal cleavage/methylation domain-containing protein/prepilin-type processing-associated H-X9-DG protein